MPVLDYYFATMSPFTYLAGRRLSDLVATHGLEVRFKPLDIMALFARTGGLPPKERHPSRQEYRLQELARGAKKAGLPLNMRPLFWPTNAAPAAYAVIAAERRRAADEAAKMDALVHAITRSCWADEKDIAQPEVIAACLSEAGFDPALAEADMLTSAETYTANLEEAIGKGVFGAPFYITEDDQRFWGQDRLEDLDAVLSGRL